MNANIAIANLILIVHIGYIGFVVVGLLLIVVGWWFKWSWIRNFWFRFLHLVAIGVVVLETVFGIRCPLTDWEDDYRKAGGQPILYFDMNDNPVTYFQKDGEDFYIDVTGRRLGENDLITSQVARDDFISRYLKHLLYIEMPKWAYPLLYFAFGGSILIAFICVPPDWPRWRRRVPEPSPAPGR